MSNDWMDTEAPLDSRERMVRISTSHFMLGDLLSLREHCRLVQEPTPNEMHAWLEVSLHRASYAIPTPRGWLIRILDEDAHSFRTPMLSTAFYDVLKWAETHCFGWLLVDELGDRIDGLPLFDPNP